MLIHSDYSGRDERNEFRVHIWRVQYYLQLHAEEKDFVILGPQSLEIFVFALLKVPL